MSKPVCFIHILGAIMVMSVWVFRIPALETIGIVLFASTYIVDVIKEKRIANFHWSREKWLYIAFILIFLMAPVWQLFTGSFTEHYYNRFMSGRIYFLLAGIVGLLGLSEKVKIKYFSFAMSAIALCAIIFLICKTDWSLLISTHNISRTSLALVRYEFISSHLFFNLFLNTTLIFIFHTLKKKDIYHPLAKVFLITSAIVIIIALSVTEGRIGLISMIIILFIFLLSQLKSKMSKTAVIGCLAILIASYFTLRYNRSCIIKNEDSNISAFIKNDRILSPTEYDSNRIILWKHGMQVIKEKPVLGYGISNARKVFNDKGMSNQEFMDYYYIPIYITEQHNPEHKYGAHAHNAFLDIWMQHGIPGLLLLLFVFLWPLIAAPSQNRLSMLLFIIVYGLQAMIDILGGALVMQALAFGLLLFMHNEGEIDKAIS